MATLSSEKQIRLIIALIRSINYSHPVILKACKELRINPEEIKPKKLEDFWDKNTCAEIHELRYQHSEKRRKARLETVAEKILQNGGNFTNLLASEAPSHKPTHSLSPKQSEKLLLTTKLDNSTIHPLTTRDLSHKKYLFQKKKLDHLLKVVGNLKQIKYEEEIKKIKIVNEIDKKQKKIEEEKNHFEEKRLKKINESQAKREEKLKKKQIV